MTEYHERFYRGWQAPEGLVTFQVKEAQSDLFIAAERDLADVALTALREARRQVEELGNSFPAFLTSLEPLELPQRAPHLCRRMAKAASLCGVGPMAAVAGAIAEEVALALLPHSSAVIVENGGDIYARVNRPLRLLLYAGKDAPAVPLVVEALPEGAGIATSSATIGPSLSLGAAQAATVLADNAALADACATALANRISRPQDLSTAVEWALSVPGVRAAAAVCAGKTALGGRGMLLG